MSPILCEQPNAGSRIPSRPSLCENPFTRMFSRPFRESAGQADMDTKGDILTSAGSDAGCHRQALLAGVDP
ncbi:MAG: hypothetical protein ACE5EQ_02005 [Phycisphaerae bacterium]